MAKTIKEKVKEKFSKVTGTKEIKLESKVTGTIINKQNPPFDPDIPEQKQRWLR